MSTISRPTFPLSSLVWRPYQAGEPESFPIDGAQIRVQLEDGREGTATFHLQFARHFTFWAPVWGPKTDVVAWAYQHWNPRLEQPAGAGESNGEMRADFAAA